MRVSDDEKGFDREKLREIIVSCDFTILEQDAKLIGAQLDV